MKSVLVLLGLLVVAGGLVIYKLDRWSDDDYAATNYGEGF